MKNKYLYILNVLFLGACAAPSSNLELLDSQADKTGYLFYINSDINLHMSELKDKLVFPAKGYGVPDNLNLLPNAKRAYRSGYHMGVDFSSPMNYPIRAVYGGIIVRSNAHQQDVDINTYNYFLNLSSLLDKTPDDIYNFILLGKSIIIDHGYNITDKYRTITVYSHLDSISEGLVAGDLVKKGDIIGMSGNTGTSFGRKKLYKVLIYTGRCFLKMIHQEIFLGQNIPNILKQNIELLFIN